MYAHVEGWIEDVCYGEEHIKDVVAEIEKNFEVYFRKFIETEAGIGVSKDSFERMKKNFGIESLGNGTDKELRNNFKTIIIESVDSFERDREADLEILDEELLEEYEDDPNTFKSKVMRNQCPVIRATLQNKKAKELDKYRAQFSRASSEEMLEVIQTLCAFADRYYNEFYDKDTYDEIEDYLELDMELMDTDEFTVYGVIGGGIKSHMLYKLYPEIFANRSRSALWALWYLSGKKTFDCEMDSEFLMIDVEKSIAQQNYFYPYELFIYYAFEIYKMLKKKAEKMNLYIDPEYRYVIVDEFLSFVADMHDDEIAVLKSQIRDGGMGFV